jgi:bifunctional UDP-N-acetylglucosamine pyrophosphorylase/glucosamine-1-phosphate N-acetyltransferase
VSPSEPSVPDNTGGPPVAAVVVLAAGQGTRMRSAVPKVLHTLGGRSMLGHVLAAVAPLGAERTVVVIGSGREAVAAHLAEIAPDALPVVQEQQNGSGHAAAVALAAVPDLTGPVLIVNGDAPLLRAGTVAGLVSTHRSSPPRWRTRPAWGASSATTPVPCWPSSRRRTPTTRSAPSAR